MRGRLRAPFFMALYANGVNRALLFRNDREGHLMKKTSVATLSNLPDRNPQYALVGEVDLVVVRFDDEISVFYGRCLHRGALMSDGFVRGKDLICGVHN